MASSSIQQREPAPLTVPRWLQIAAFLALAVAAWLCLYLDALDFGFSGPVRQVIETFPLWSVVALGAYALGNIGWNLMRFNSCPEAAEELRKDIAAAKADLRKKGLQMEY